MLNLLLTILVLVVLYFFLFKLLPVVGAIPFLLARVKPSNITGIRLFILTIIYVPLALLIIHGVMYLKGYGLPKLLLPVAGSDVYFGLVAGIVIALLNLSIDLVLKKMLNENFASTLQQIGNFPLGLFAMIGVGWLAGGILEEVFWRGHLVTPIIAHGIMDTLLLLIIWFWFGRRLYDHP